jgi:hypothetical protein
MHYNKLPSQYAVYVTYQRPIYCTELEKIPLFPSFVICLLLPCRPLLSPGRGEGSAGGGDVDGGGRRRREGERRERENVRHEPEIKVERAAEMERGKDCCAETVLFFFKFGH